jgi:acyl-CoA thioester hydrolase
VAYADFRHRMPLRVRWAEVDQQGVVFNAHYLLYADLCITEYWRAIGMQYPADFLAQGADLYARKATVEFRAAAAYDEMLEACGRIVRLGTTSLQFAIELYRSGQTERALATVELVYVHVEPAARTPTRVSDELRKLVRGFERVAPVDVDAR